MNISAKRTFDLFFSILGIILLSPLIIFGALAIKLSDFGPVFYKPQRVGRNGKLFNMFKFRTMVAGADKIGASSTKKEDSRITQIGRFFRKYKLDEIPQLFNIVKGEMSFVGPRPQIEWAVRLYTEEQKRVLTVRPGITDYASLKFHNEAEILSGSDDPDKAYMELIHPEKMRLSLEYIDKMSLITDIKIIINTLLTI